MWSVNTYRIRFRRDAKSQVVKADTVNGFQPTADSYVFKIEEEVVAVFPKDAVLSVTKIGPGEDVA